MVLALVYQHIFFYEHTYLLFTLIKDMFKIHFGKKNVGGSGGLGIVYKSFLNLPFWDTFYHMTGTGFDLIYMQVIFVHLIFWGLIFL